jgi:hypothetical protein
VPVKIFSDNINSLPPHSISRKEVETILNCLPVDFSGTVVKFKISAQLFSNSGWDRPVIYNNTTYNILSRGLDKKEVIRELLIEIFCHESRIGLHVKGHALSKEQRKKLEALIQPHCEVVLKALKLADNTAPGDTVDSSTSCK